MTYVFKNMYIQESVGAQLKNESLSLCFPKFITDLNKSKCKIDG